MTTKYFNVKSGLSTGNILVSESNVTLGNVANLHITGGNLGYRLTTDGAGNLSWAEGSSGGASISDTAPSSPSAGDLWWDSSTGTLKIYYDDGNGQQWVDASPTLVNDFVVPPGSIDTPTGISPEADEEIIQDITFTLSASAYSGTYAHVSTDWQISTESDFGNTVVNVSASTTALTSYEVTGGLSSIDTYYWRVRYRDSDETVSDWSTGILFDIISAGPTAYGESYGGGIYMGTICAAGSCYYLIVSPNSTGLACCQWKTTRTATSGATSNVDGYTNTYGPLDNATHPAGNWCATRTLNGFSDWYLPAIEELQQFWNNGGTNECVIGVGETFFSFPCPQYWSSTDASAAQNACYLQFNNGARSSSCKVGTRRVRAVRRVPI